MKTVIQSVGYFFTGLLIILLFVSLIGGVIRWNVSGGDDKVEVDKPSILLMDLEGPILSGKKFLKDLKKYASQKNIKGVLVRVNSPGGVVGPSQEIYAELKRVRDELQKPVVVSCGALAASGAYYISVAADQIITNPGTIMGSIGVIMDFANLSELYKWLKIERYSLKTGPYKDSGADYRKMTPEEKEIFQDMINDVYGQFKKAVAKGRKLSDEVVNKYADGRVFSGETAVKLGFADQVGTYEDALRVIGELSGLGAEPKVIEPSDDPKDVLKLILQDLNSQSPLQNIFEGLLKVKAYGQPLYMLPGVLGS